jgi:ketosteroid isomerase-like protein
VPFFIAALDLAGLCNSLTRKRKRDWVAILPSVSAENVERVRRWLIPISEQRGGVRADVAEFCDPDVDYYPVRKFPEARPCHGLKEFSRFLDRFWETYSRGEWTNHELIPIGDDRVLACLTLRAEGRESGIKLEGDLYQCVWLRHGRFFRVEDHLTLSGALHALGLKGETLAAAGLRAPPNVELVRSLYSAWERGDYSSIDWADPEIEYVHPDGPEPGRWIGLAGMREAARERLSAWDEYRPEDEEYLELDDSRVLVLNRFSGRGKTSGLELGEIRPKGATLFELRDGKVTRIAQYLDRERALADVGLPSQAS